MKNEKEMIVRGETSPKSDIICPEGRKPGVRRAGRMAKKNIGYCPNCNKGVKLPE